MKRMTFVSWVLAVAGLCCGNDGAPGAKGTAGSGGSSAGSTGGSAGGSTGGSAGGSTGGSTQDAGDASTGEEGLRDRLRVALAPITQPPFGTAAAVTALHGNLRGTVTLGTLWDGGPEADENTRFNVASVSKLLTAARVVSLAQEGALGLDDPLSAHLPGVKLVGVGGGEPTEVITLRHLLTHCSGLPHQPPDLVEHVGGEWTSPDLLRKMTESWEIELVGSPGDYRYSNLGYALLGAVVEREGGCSFADCMADYLQGALGMSGSTFWPATLNDNAAHGRVEAQGEAEFHAPAWYGSRYAIPFTGLWTTTPELAQFGGALAAASTDPASALHAMTVGQGHGLGPVHAVRLGAPSLEHDGSGPGFYAALVVIPDRDVVVAIVTNGGNETKSEVSTFTQVVSAAVSAVPEP